MILYAGQTLSELAGTPAYMAPEFFMNRYTTKVDVWAAGVILHELLTGTLPFQQESMESMYQATRKFVRLDFQDKVWKSVSNSAKDLALRMLSKDIKMRLSPEEILSMYCSAWISFFLIIIIIITYLDGAILIMFTYIL